MNPFDLTGPQFLVFYFVFASLILVTLDQLRRAREGGTVDARLTDPYQIAYLRGGKQAAIQTALVALIDRKILRVKFEMTVVSKTFANEKLADPLERALRDACQEEHDAFKLQKLPFREVFDAYDRELQEKGFLPGPSAKLIQARDLTAGLIALVGVSAIKIGVALSRGRTNIIFLVLMTVIAIVLACKVTSPRITLRSKRFLEDLARLWQGTEGRKASLYPHSGSKDLVFLSAVFGMSILPERAFPDKRLVFKEPAAAGCSSGSGCGSSSSDSGSSGGSSCGGGGCGGCGGGGGCGS